MFESWGLTTVTLSKFSILRGLRVPAAALLGCLFMGSAGATTLLYDVNDVGTNNTQAGGTATNLNGANGVTFTAVGGTRLDDRDRGNRNTNGAGGDTANNGMWRDFIFADQRNRTIPNPAAAGMDISISGLQAFTEYAVRLWAFDDSSNGGRNMTWNGNALHIPTDGDPTSLSDQVVTFNVQTDASGSVVLEGRIGASPGRCCNVFVNGFELTSIGAVVASLDIDVPEPASLAILGLGLFGFGMARRRRV